MENFREFDAGPDPFGRTFHVLFKWLQTAISIRHSDTVDVKFILSEGSNQTEKTITLPHSELKDIAKRLGAKMTDSWCARIAMLHLRYLIESGEDMEKELVRPAMAEMERYAGAVGKWEDEQVHKRRGAA